MLCELDWEREPIYFASTAGEIKQRLTPINGLSIKFMYFLSNVKKVNIRNFKGQLGGQTDPARMLTLHIPVLCWAKLQVCFILWWLLLVSERTDEIPCAWSTLSTIGFDAKIQILLVQEEDSILWGKFKLTMIEHVVVQTTTISFWSWPSKKTYGILYFPKFIKPRPGLLVDYINW